MSRFVAALALAVPLCAGADLVHVEYEGVVQAVTGSSLCPACDFAPDNPEYVGYSVGDRISGFMTIDLAAAPPDSRPRERALGIYRAPPTSNGYIRSIGNPLIHFGGTLVDTVSVRDGGGDDRFEHYRIIDQFSTPNGLGQLAVNVDSRRAGRDLVTGDGIAQTFDATAGDGLTITGHLRKLFNAPEGSASVLFSLLFDRVKVTAPGLCKR